MAKRAHPSLRILVVEDNPNILRIMKELLDAEGHEVRIAEDGEGGLRYVESEEFDLIVTDLGLPGMSGWDLARASRRCQSDIPVVAISSWQGKGAKEKMAEFGINVVIWKPFRFDEVRDAIETLCYPGCSPDHAK